MPGEADTRFVIARRVHIGRSFKAAFNSAIRESKTGSAGGGDKGWVGAIGISCGT